MKISQVGRLTGHNSAIYALLASEDDTFLSGAGDGWVARWPMVGVNDGQLVCDVTEQIFSMAMQNGVLLIGGMDGHVYFIDLNEAAEPRKIQYHSKGVFAIQIIREMVLTAGGDGKIAVWDLNMKLREVLAISHKSLRSLSLSQDGSMLAIGASDGNIYILNLWEFKVITTLSGAHDPSVFCLAFIGQDLLVSGGRDAHLKVWDLKSGLAIEDINAHWYTINALALHPTRPILATASRDRSIRIWNLDDWSPIVTLDQMKYQGHLNSVNDIIWNRSGNHLISASDDRSIIVWECNF